MALIMQTNGEQNSLLTSHYEFRTTTMCGVNLSAPSLPPDPDPLRENPHQCRWKTPWIQMERTPDASSAGETETPQSDKRLLDPITQTNLFLFSGGRAASWPSPRGPESRAQSNRRDQYDLLNKLLLNPVFG